MSHEVEPVPEVAVQASCHSRLLGGSPYIAEQACNFMDRVTAPSVLV